MSGEATRALSQATLAAVARRLDPAARLIAARPLAGGVSATMIALDLEGGGGDRTVILRLPGPENLKADPQSAAHEHRLLGLLAERRIPAPRPLLLDTTRDLVAMDYLVIGWLDGAVDFAPADPLAAVHAMAELLARIHGIRDSPDFAFLPLHRNPLGLQEGGYLADDHPARLDADEGRTVERLVKTGHLESVASRSVLLHGDFWPGNMLWRDGSLVAALDWEDAAIGHPLSDVAIARLDIAIFFGMEAAEAFTKRYAARARQDLSALPLWDLYACQRAPADYAAWGQDWAEQGRPDIDAAAMERGRSAILARALEALDREARDLPFI